MQSDWETSIIWLVILGLLLLAGALLLFFPKRVSPTLFFPTISLWKGSFSSWREKLVFFPESLLIAALIALLIAWFNPKTAETITQSTSKGPPKEGVLLLLALDRSSSMRADSGNGINRMERLKEITEQFITGDVEQGLQGRSNDLVGMVAFARIPTILSPPTLDHEHLLKQLHHLHPVREQSQDGTAIGYAIFRAAQWLASARHFSQKLEEEGKEGYKIKDMAIIVVTDGLQNPHPEDGDDPQRAMSLEQAALFAKEQNIHLYIVNIEPLIGTERFDPERRQMERVTQLTGGKFFFVQNHQTIVDIFHEIDQLEKSSLGNQASPLELQYERSHAANWIAAGWLLTTVALLLQFTWLRRYP